MKLDKKIRGETRKVWSGTELRGGEKRERSRISICSLTRRKRKEDRERDRWSDVMREDVK